MRIVALRWTTLFLAFFLLTGCIAQQVETDINADGSGTNVLRTGLTKEAMNALSGMGEGSDSNPLEDAQSAMDDAPPEWNVQPSAWEDDTFQGAEFQMDFSNIQMLQEQLTYMLTSDSSASSGMFSDISVEDVNDEFVISMTANTNMEGGEMDEFGGAEMFADASIYWEVTMPGGIQSFEPQDIAVQEGNTIRWTFPLDQPNTYNVRVVAAKSGGAGAASPLVWVLGGVGTLVVLAGVGMLLMNRGKSSTPVPAVGGGGYDQGSWGQQPPAASYNQGQPAYDQQNHAQPQSDQQAYDRPAADYDPESYAPEHRPDQASGDPTTRL